jgi:hypothetical protein
MTMLVFWSSNVAGDRGVINWPDSGESRPPVSPAGWIAFKRWMKREQRTIEAVAKEVGVTRETVSRWINKRQSPSLEHYEVLEKMSGVRLRAIKVRLRRRRAIPTIIGWAAGLLMPLHLHQHLAELVFRTVRVSVF